MLLALSNCCVKRDKHTTSGQDPLERDSVSHDRGQIIGGGKEKTAGVFGGLTESLGKIPRNSLSKTQKKKFIVWWWWGRPPLRLKVETFYFFDCFFLTPHPTEKYHVIQ